MIKTSIRQQVDLPDMMPLHVKVLSVAGRQVTQQIGSQLWFKIHQIRDDIDDQLCAIALGPIAKSINDSILKGSL